MRALILGKGLSGKGAALLLSSLGFFYEFYQDGNGLPDLSLFDFAVKSPGFPINHKILQYLSKKDVPTLGEIELAFRFSRGKIVSVTGTNGKSTTTALIHHTLKINGYKTFIGGNFGIPFSEFALKTTPETISAIELSSFQIEDLKSYRSNVSVILNVTPDHMNRYRDFTEYRNAKLKLIKHSDLTVLNRDDEQLRNLKGNNLIFFSTRRKADTYVAKNKLIINLKNRVELPLTELPLKGIHNLENYTAAATVLSILGLNEKEILRGFKSFKGLPHRTEIVETVKGVTFVNDSKSTNPDSLKKALESFKNIILIAGGSDKGLDFGHLKELVRERVKAAVFIGETAELLSQTFREETLTLTANSMEEAVRKAFELSDVGDTVLLSPGCASFDMFKNFEERGEAFKREVLKLKEKLEEKIEN